MKQPGFILWSVGGDCFAALSIVSVSMARVRVNFDDITGEWEVCFEEFFSAGRPAGSLIPFDYQSVKKVLDSIHTTWSKNRSVKQERN